MSDWDSIYDQFFYPAYPRKRGKADGRKAWNSKKPRNPAQNRALANEILDRLEEFLEDEWADRDPRYIPYPGTWLRMEEFSLPRAQSSAAPQNSAAPTRGSQRPRLLPFPGPTTVKASGENGA